MRLHFITLICNIWLFTLTISTAATFEFTCDDNSSQDTCRYDSIKDLVTSTTSANITLANTTCCLCSGIKGLANNITVGACKYKINMLEPFEKYQIPFICTNSDNREQRCNIHLETKKCKGLAIDNFDSKYGNDSIQVTVINLKENHCPLEYYTITNGLKIHVLQNDTQFKDIMMDPEYNITISFIKEVTNRTENSSSVYFPVSNRALSIKVNNVKSTSAQISITSSHEVDELTINYRVIRYKACDDNGNYSVMSFQTDDLKLHLTELHPFAVYKISVLKDELHNYTTFQTEPADNLSEADANVTISYPNVTFPECNTLTGLVKYKIYITYVGSENGTDYNIEYGNDAIQHILKSLESYSNYSIEILATRNNSKSIAKRINITTPSTKPGPVLDLSIYSIDYQSFSLKWKEPYPSTGEIEAYIVEYYLGKECWNITDVSVCSLWDQYQCANIQNLTKNEEYSIEVYAKNRNVPEYGPRISLKERTKTYDCPIILSVEIENCSILLEWKYLSRVTSYLITAKPNRMNAPIVIKDISSKYLNNSHTYRINDVQNNTVYKIYIEERGINIKNKSRPVEIASCFSVDHTKLSYIIPLSISVAVITILVFIGAAIKIKTYKLKTTQSTGETARCLIIDDANVAGLNELMFEMQPILREYVPLASRVDEKISDEESVIDISNSNGAVTLPKCDVIRGPLFYNLTSTCLEIWCNEAKYNHTNFAYNESSKLKDFINNLTPFSKHRLEINVSRSISNKEQSSIKIPPLNIISPAGKPTKVSDAVAYPCNGSLCIKWKPPYPPTGDIDGYIVKVNNTEINHNCSLPHSNCSIIYDNAEPNVPYNIQIIANNKDVTKLGSAVLINIIENTNITINVMKNCDVVLEWRHPFFTNINTTFKIKIAEIGNGDNNNETHDIAANNLVGNYTFTNLSMATVYYIQVEVHDSKFIAGPTSFQITTCDSPLTLEALTKGYAPHLIISTAVLIIVIMIILISIFMLIRRRKFMSMTNKRKDLEDFNLVQRDDKIVSQRTDYCQLMRTLVCNNMYLDLLGEEYKEVWDKMNIWYEIIFPNQFCSVVVEEEMHLNAHFVQGWRGENTYIAAQCPRGDYSVELFWNAVWDKNIRIIVSLLTKAEAELAMNKYWPEDMYKNTQETLEVRYVSSDFHTDYAIRKFAITKNNQELQVRHFNFFSFPFDDFPTYPTSFINFLKHIKGIDITSTPLLVHCGDGLGRTGVFIMSYNFMRCKESFVNIQKYLEDIRKCRPMLLNVFEQYQFVYYILHQIFADYYSSLTLTTFLGYDIHSINEKIHKDFDYLARTDYTYKMFRRKRKIPNEIKAAVVPGYENQCNYFAVPKVEKNDINRFWKYIMSSGIKMIIVLQNIDEQENKFWPSYGSSRSFDDILIQSKDHYKQNDIKIYKLGVLQKQQKEKTITLIYYKQWKSKSNVPTSEKDFYSLLKCYYALTVAEEDIILCCKDGLIGCGLFICADLILQKIKHEATFDLVWAVHGLKFIDKNFMKELDQHRFLYALAKYYLDVVENEDGYHEYSIVAQSTKVADVANIYDRIV